MPPYRAPSTQSAAAAARFPARFHAVRRWVGRHLGAVDHERRVAAVAATLFDLTDSLHDLSPADRRLLQLAALVHDVGRCVSKADHPADGAALIAADATLPLAPAQRRALAYLTRYHKGRVPPAGRDAVLHRNDPHGRLRGVLALLRAADALDSRSAEVLAPRLVFALDGGRAGAGRLSLGGPRVLRVTCYLERDCAKSRRVYRRRKKFRLLEELTGLRVEVQVARAEALRMVA